MPLGNDEIWHGPNCGGESPVKLFRCTIKKGVHNDVAECVDNTGQFSCRRADAAESCANSNFLKGVAWSPDGACLLTASDDNR